MQQNKTEKFDASGEVGSIRRVLVVDDSRLQRRILCSSLKKLGFEIVEAESGEEGLEICGREPPDLILSDWMMPGMSGLEFCQSFRLMSGDNYAYFILLTSNSEKYDVAQGLDAGADDFLTKPVNPGELRARISAGARIVGMQRELSDANRVATDTLDKLQEVYDSIDRDLMQARSIQQSLVPELTRKFGASQVSLLLKPCGHIGGDLVGMFSPGLGTVGFYSIDVSGHGITSAMMTARLGGYLSSTHFEQNLAMKPHTYHYQLNQPEDVATALNNRLAADSGVEEYFTMVYAVINLYNGALKMVQAGHPHPLILRKDGSTEFIGDGGMPIGLMPGVQYQQFAAKLEIGDRLLLYSDGFTECRIEDGDMLEPEGLLDLIKKCDSNQSGQEFLDDLYWNLSEVMSKQYGMEDDVSATLFEYGRF
ncbi:MAG: fused response regulator/phosphatase [Rhodospirillales bacterium]|nr:fused response regulator/phosphatase [Rhodospirillales bacterium]